MPTHDKQTSAAIDTHTKTPHKQNLNNTRKSHKITQHTQQQQQTHIQKTINQQNRTLGNTRTNQQTIEIINNTTNRNTHTYETMAKHNNT